LYVLPVEGKETLVYDSLVDAHPNLTVYYKDQIPEYWEYQKNRRITPIFASLSLGWSVTTSAYFNANPTAFDGGNHGYDNRMADMQAIFMARGPQFKTGGKMVEPFENIHLYSLMCHILNLEAAPNNGSYLEIEYLLK
jgi:ectonucleotide pyrophosphatase/phosphodiesterase family protein 5